jgi:hypothetical protein
MRYLSLRFISLLICLFFLASACKPGAPADPKRAEAMTKLKKHYSEINDKLSKDKDCHKRLEKAGDYLKEKREDIATILKDFNDMPNANEEKELEKVLEPGWKEFDKCVAELEKGKDKKGLKKVEEESKRFKSKMKKINKLADAMREEEAERKKIEEAEAAEKAAADLKAAEEKAAADKAAADKAAADKAAADKAAADKAAADAAANPPADGQPAPDPTPAPQ